MPQSKESIKGVVEHITYRNETNGYTVCSVRSGTEHTVAVGIFPFLTEGTNGTFFGQYTVHPTYGQQFKADYFEQSVPETSAAILRYLSSGVIRGIGPATATRIVEKFGTDALDVIQNHPAELATLKGISLQKALAVSEEYGKQFGIRELMLALAPYAVSPEKCVQIYRVLGQSAHERIRENPYILCSEGMDFPFEKVEEIAFAFEVSPDCEERICAGVEYILRKNLANGHTCLPREKLIGVAVRLLESDYDRIGQICDRMVSQFLLSEFKMGDTAFLALPEYYNAERHIAARLCALRDGADTAVRVDDLEIDYVENKLKIKFEALQRTAIRAAFESGVMILTGGPGTGKTTTLNAMIELFENRGAALMLAAPTGRAAKRMTELTGREAKTVHRLLEVNFGPDERQEFSRNEKNPLECDVLIVDEVSMLDSLLFENLLKALRPSCRLILVGDADQLPSVSAGNVLGDLLASGAFSSVALKKVFRQAGKSAIVMTAHAIINETRPDFSDRSKDCFFLHRSGVQDVCATVAELCCERLPKAYGWDAFRNIQVLCPSRKTDCGTVHLNTMLQELLNPQKKDEPSFTYKGIRFSRGDKVMQIKNNYDLIWEKENGESGSGVFNGDIGTVTAVDRRGGTMKVRFEDRTVTYFGEELGELELAYALTVHKSQGSEFDCVVIPLCEVPSQLRYRNLLYTAVTRAKKMLIFVGQEELFFAMAENKRKMLRYTMLTDFLRNG